MKPLDSVFGPKIAGTRVIPIVTKIVTLFTVFLLVSNIASNYINITMSRGQLNSLANRLLVKDLGEIFSFSSNEYEIYRFNGQRDAALSAIQQNALVNLQSRHSNAFGVTQDGALLFWASKDKKPESFADQKALAEMRSSTAAKGEGKLSFSLDGKSFFGVYKYSEKWGAFIIRAEELSEFEAETRAIFVRVVIIIIIMTILCIIVGALLVRHLLRYVNTMTQSLMKMQNDQKMQLIDLSEAQNDDVTYLGASFNALSSTIDNLLSIFRRFVTQDVAQQAYHEHEIRLEGTTRELTILFSDIKGFTFMTETLGHDIIDVLNLHYQRAISRIHEENGIVGSIIGDALLAVFGTLPEGRDTNKSLDAVRAAYLVQEVALELRENIKTEADKILARKGSLSEAEQRVYQAVLLEVGVGIDGGDVFYGNIGSYERMTNTVIGDNVNSASRLEGLTRIYHLPVICSEFVKDEVERVCADYRFVEIDTVQVKGKTEGKRIYWPARVDHIDAPLEEQITAFSCGLAAYYAGDWRKAEEEWKPVSLPLATVFRSRIAGTEAPRDWNGIWAMTTK